MPNEPLHIEIPRHQWNDQASDMRSRLQTWQWRWKQCEKHGAVLIDFSKVEFMEPWALAMFTCFALKLRVSGVAVRLGLDPNNPSNRYFGQMGIEQVVHTGDSTDRWDEHLHNTGLHILRNHGHVTRFIRSAAALGAGFGGDVRNALEYGMAELGRNVVQHAASVVGGVAIAQHFPESRALQVAICDAGQGVFEALRGNYPEVRSDLEALKLAVLPHSSGAPLPVDPYASSENAGLGLFFCKEICWRAGGSFWMVSNTALLGARDNESSGRGRIYRTVEPWPGTLVVMHLPDQLLVDFADLLSVCRELSRQARADASAAGLDFIDEASARDHEQEEGLCVVAVGQFREDVEKAAQVRDATIRPAIEAGHPVLVDFGGVSFVTQSFVHALFYDIFRTPGSLTKLSFSRCTKSTEEAIRLVAAYSQAGYRQREF